jgi:ligand-binding sensor domain-containing protein/signal transduction histidine kinase
MRRFHTGLLLLALLWFGPASEASSVRIFNTENGLPHNRVNRIYADSKGLMWICTDDGLSLFDGHRFVNYNTSSGLPHIHVNAALETRNGEFWLATDGGVSRFDPRPGRTRFTNYAPGGPVEASYINALAEARDGALLLGTDTGLYRLRDPGTAPVFERIDFQQPGDPASAGKVHALAHDARGRLWLATQNGLYQRRDDGGWNHFGSKNGVPPLVLSFASDPEGRLWVGFRGGFGRLRAEVAPGASVWDRVSTAATGVPGQEVRVIWFASDGRRWIGTDVGLREWTIEPGGTLRVRADAPQEGFPSETVLSIGEDAAGNLWIGSRRSGLFRTAASRFEVFGASDGLAFGRNQTVLQLQSGEIAVFDVGSDRNRIFSRASNRFAFTVPALPSIASAPFWLQTAWQDRAGAWWLSTVSGLFRFPTLAGPPDLRLLNGIQVDRFFEDAAGDLWISNWPPDQRHASLTRWQRSSQLMVDETGRLPRTALTVGIAAFAQDNSGTIWIGLQRPGGLLRLRNGRFEPVAPALRGHIAQLFVDSRGRLWIASTETGLGLIEDPAAADPRPRLYTRADGLSGEEVWCVAEDWLGRIYAGTARGVDRLHPVSGQITHYSSADGLVRGDIRSALRDRAGDLWFASANGLARFTPAEDGATPPARARITGLRAAGVPIPLSEFGEADVGPLRLGANQSSLQVDFAATDFHELAPLRYQFRLTHQRRAREDDGWQSAGPLASVYLGNLAPGDYDFSVRALTTAGLPGPPAMLRFAIRTPFWRTSWFQIACALALAALAVFVHTQRLRSRVAIERVRSDIAMDLHDDIGASLSRMAVLSESLKSRLRVGDDDVRQMLDDMAGSSRRLVRDMSDIVWSLDPRRDQIGDLASRLRAFGSDLLETRGVEWTVDAPLEESQQRLPSDVRRQLYLVFKEGIHNIGKHADARRATLRLQVDDGRVSGELIDDGRGIAPGALSGNGLGSMRARVAHLAGSIDIVHAGDGGTRVHIVVPLPGRG